MIRVDKYSEKYYEVINAVAKAGSRIFTSRKGKEEPENSFTFTRRTKNRATAQIKDIGGRSLLALFTAWLLAYVADENAMPRTSFVKFIFGEIVLQMHMCRMPLVRNYILLSISSP